MSEIICQIDFTNKTIIEEFKTIEEIVIKFSNINDVKIKILSCLNNTIKIFNGFGWIYKFKLDNIGINSYINNDKIIDKKRNLFINCYPHLIAEWDFQRNTDIDINKITYASNKKVWWKCLNNIKHPYYFTKVYHKTCDSSKCKECYHDSMRIYDKDEKEEHIQKHIEKSKNNLNINTISIGDDIELYITNLLISSKEYNIVDRIGQTGDKTDIIVTLKSGIRKSIQVKTISSTECADVYHMNNDHKLPDNMLVIMSNIHKTRFAVDFSKNIMHSALPFNNTTSKYKDIMFIDEKDFLKRIIELIPLSIDYSGFISSESVMKEYNSALRLEDWCKVKGYRYRRNITNGTTIDLYINDISIQAKYRTLNVSGQYTYQINITKSAGLFHSKRIKMSCTIDEPFEYLMIEVGGIEKEPTKYNGQFCFIPKSVLIERKVLRTSTHKGRTSICVCPPDYHDETHWSKKYWVDPFAKQ